PATLWRLAQLQAPPIVPAWPFRARAGTERLPAIGWQLSQDGLDLPLMRGYPDSFFARNYQHVGLRTAFQPLSQGAVIAVDAIARDPGQHHASFEGALQHLQRQGWFGGKSTLIGNAGSPTTLAIVDPLLWQIQLAIEKRVAVRARIGQKHADLAVLTFSGSTAILARHSGGMASFLEKAGLVEYTDGIPIGQIVGQIAAQLVAQEIGIPVGAPKQMLKAIGIGIAADLGQLPAILRSAGESRAAR